MRIAFSGAEDESLNTKPIEIAEQTISARNIRRLADVIQYVYDTEPRAHRSFFQPDGSLANGTICLLDSQDMEVLDGDQQAVTAGSEVVFISTLHGG